MITILNNSPMSYSGLGPSTPNRYYLNDNDENKLFFTSTGNTLYYVVIRKDSDYSRVISAGKLSGHYNNTDYDYRFDFNNYISIDNQTVPDVINYDDYSLTFKGNNSSKLYLVLSSTEIVNTNLLNESMTKLINGEIIINPLKSIVDVDCDDYLYLQFLDRKYDNNIDINYNRNGLVNDCIYPITLTDLSFEYRVEMYNIAGEVVNVSYIDSDDNYDYRVFLFYITNISKIMLYRHINTSYILFDTLIVNNTKVCHNDYFFFDEEGSFNAVRLFGNKNEVDTVNKENIQLGNKLIQTKIRTIKQVKQNTGYNLTEKEIRGMLNAPFLYTSYSYVDTIAFRSYNLDTNSFNGYKGTKLSGKNIELVLTDPVQYQRKTNYTVNFFD